MQLCFAKGRADSKIRQVCLIAACDQSMQVDDLDMPLKAGEFVNIRAAQGHDQSKQ
jgi:hypothetical protein